MRAVVIGMVAVLLAGAAERSHAQDTTAAGDSAWVPVPPTEQLARLRPYLGLYQHSGQTWISDRPGQGPWRGTLEVKPAGKGWYVDWIISTQSGPIDRQLRMLVTWSVEGNEYRVWRFGSTPGDAGHMGRVRFEGDALIMEWNGAPMPDGSRGTFRNIVRLHGDDELVIRSEAENSEGSVVLLGEWTNRRLL
jgi:hypothetical protein